jgi:hypothetical protein
MNTRPRRRVKKHTPESLRRKAVLKASGYTYGDLADRAGVKWRMVKWWMDEERTSANVARAFDELIRTTKAS